jgi:outer membrane protein, multidrug efflux system
VKKLCVLLFFLAGCVQLQGPYTVPSTQLSKEWKGEHIYSGLDQGRSIEDSEAQFCSWWRLFDDPLLDEYEAAAIENNQTVAVFYHRMAQAFYLSQSTSGSLFPFAAFNPSFFKEGSRLPFEEINSQSHGRSERNVFTADELVLNFGWEVDLWGKISQAYLSSFYSYQSSYFSFTSTLNQITSDLAVNYYLLRGYDSEIEVLNKLIDLRRDNFELNQFRYHAGLIDYLDVTRAEVDLWSAESERENVIRQRGLQENILAVLQDKVASEFHVPFLPLPLEVSPPIIPIYIPCDVLINRPDIRAAERNIASFHSNIGVAYASFFPSLNLSGSLGFASTTIDSLLNWKSRLWREAVNSAQIIFDGGQLQANLSQSKEAYYEAISLYQDAVLNAIKEVEDALCNMAQHAAQQEALMRTYLAARDTYNLANERYECGLINYLDVVIAERDLLHAARSVAIVHAQRFVDTALLVKALGSVQE